MAADAAAVPVDDQDNKMEAQERPEITSMQGESEGWIEAVSKAPHRLGRMPMQRSLDHPLYVPVSVNHHHQTDCWPCLFRVPSVLQQGLAQPGNGSIHAPLEVSGGCSAIREPADCRHTQVSASCNPLGKKLLQLDWSLPAV